MKRKLDWPALLLFTALLFGAVVRFWPAISNDFPLNDGGMFYTMIGDLQANHFSLPQTTSYNHENIPFAYPPLGFYIAASLSALLPVATLGILLYLPALINTFSILAFYKLAEEILHSRLTAALATLIYALSARAFVWQVMGGGITRAFGIFCLLLMLWQAVNLFRASSNTMRPLILTILFGAGAVLSHPQTALHAALGGALICLFYGWNKRGVISALGVGLGVAALSALWWGTVLARYGLAPLLSASQTSQRTLAAYLALIQFNGLGDYLFLPTLLLALTGIYVACTRREFFLITWAVVAELVDPRGGAGIALLALSMLAGMGLLKLSTWLSHSDSQQEEGPFEKRGVQLLVFGFTLYFVLSASIFDFQLINTSLKAEDLKMISWVQSNVPEGKTFLLSTGIEYSMSDPLQEWFPALTGQYSATTMQGLEWSLGKNFFPWYDQLIAFQHCADMACVNEWSDQNKINYDYLVVAIPPAGDQSDLANSLGSLVASAHGSDLKLAYKSKNFLVFGK